MHTSSVLLLLLTAASVAVLHSILPDHWVPLAVVARTNRWSLGRVARVSFLASAGHVLASVVLGGIIAAIGLRFQKQIDVQQGHLIGAVLVLTGLGFLVWGLLGHGHRHGHGHGHGLTHSHSDNITPSYPFEWAGLYEITAGNYEFTLEAGPDPAMRVALLPVAAPTSTALEAAQRDAVDVFKGTAHDISGGGIIQPGRAPIQLLLDGAGNFVVRITESGSYVLFTEHHPDEFSAALRHDGPVVSTVLQQEYPSEHGHAHGQTDEQKTLAQRLAAIAVPFGVAASPDLTILPVALAASAVGLGLVIGVLLVFTVVTMATFVGLTVLATVLGYQVKGAWLDKNATILTSLMLLAIGVVAFIGF